MGGRSERWQAVMGQPAPWRIRDVDSKALQKDGARIGDCVFAFTNLHRFQSLRHFHIGGGGRAYPVKTLATTATVSAPPSTL